MHEGTLQRRVGHIGVNFVLMFIFLLCYVYILGAYYEWQEEYLIYNYDWNFPMINFTLNRVIPCIVLLVFIASATRILKKGK